MESNHKENDIEKRDPLLDANDEEIKDNNGNLSDHIEDEDEEKQKQENKASIK